MIGSINEGTVKVAAKMDSGGLAYSHEIGAQKTEAARRTRPVEQADAGTEAGSRKRRKEESEESSKYLLEEDTIVFEKYNRNGDLIVRLPPRQKPVDERA